MAEGKGGDMSRYGKVFVAVAVLCVLGWGPWGETSQAASTVFHSYAKPVAPPDFAIEDLNGKKINFKDPSGEVVLVNFWATW
jgi:cytochrome oxidase Cu insertion factor (SCO1/SenC/PrrC family)